MLDEKKTILLVDDDEDYLFQQRIQLEAAGFKVVSAQSRAKAMSLLDSVEDYDIAVVDLMMEEMDAGFTLCQEIKRRRQSLPVIMVTAVESETGIEFDAKTSEERSWIKADAMLAKPVRLEQLTTEIKRLTKG